MNLHFLIANEPIRKFLVKYLSTKDIIQLSYIFPRTIIKDNYICRNIYKILLKNNRLTENCREKITSWNDFLEENRKVLKNNFRLLIDAIKRNHMDDVIKYVNEGVNINDSIQFFKETALMTACWQKNSEIVEYLINKGSNLNIATDIGNTALHICVLNLSKDCLEILIKNGADLNIKNKFGNTPLMLACENQIFDYVEKLLYSGDSLFQENWLGKTALDYVCENDCLYLSKLFIERGADVRHKKKNGSTVVYGCVHNGNYKLLKYLLLNTSAYKDVNIGTKNDNGYSPIHAASLHSNDNGFRMALLLCMFDADINIKAKNGITPLHLAIYKDNITMVSLLLAKWALIEEELSDYENDPILYNENTRSYICPLLVGVSPLLMACEKGNIEIFRMLVLTRKNIDLNVCDKNGKTPLMIAIESSSNNIVRFLLSEENNNINNININQTDKDGRTALFLAIRYMNLDMINHLMSKGADYTICDKNGNNALEMAEEINDTLF